MIKEMIIKPKSFRGKIAMILVNLARKLAPEEKYHEHYMFKIVNKEMDKIIPSLIIDNMTKTFRGSRLRRKSRMRPAKIDYSKMN